MKCWTINDDGSIKEGISASFFPLLDSDDVVLDYAYLSYSSSDYGIPEEELDKLPVNEATELCQVVVSPEKKSEWNGLSHMIAFNAHLYIPAARLGDASDSLIKGNNTVLCGKEGEIILVPVQDGLDIAYIVSDKRLIHTSLSAQVKKRALSLAKGEPYAIKPVEPPVFKEKLKVPKIFKERRKK